MSCSMKLLTQNQFAGVPHRRFLSRLLCAAAPLERDNEIDRITKIINDHPFPDSPLQPVLQKHILPHTLSIGLVEDVLGHLFGAHLNGLKALEFFRYTVRHSLCGPTSVEFERTLHILVRMRYFEKAWELMDEMRVMHPSLLTFKAMSIMISKIAKFKSYEDTLLAFERMEHDVFVGRQFGTDEFNILLRAFCTQRQMKEARSVFNKIHSRFSPDSKTMNILLLGFKESGDVTSVELFYHEMVRRGFKPNTVTYNTVTTLIHGAGVARNLTKAKELFDGIFTRNMQPDTAAYNAMISALIKAKYVKAAIALMDEMEAKQIGHDNMTYHTMFFGLMKSKEIDEVCELYNKMVERNFVPKTRTVVMLMKYFCINGQVDLGLRLWEYLVGKGHCPHGHALDLLVIGLCSHGRVLEAFECSKQMLERGRLMTEATFRMLGGLLLQAGEANKLRKLSELLKKLKAVLPLSTGHADGATNSSVFNAERMFST
ncbi:hypothetical protein ACJRO7_016990 [Eucalyptus globulus]|uniref:Pentatricopeptide repeat-containing protein n=1 Tax=Eucalyptus globulus TaxID=34317 RepID=A0ABD3KZY7_EUCGL